MGRGEVSNSSRPIKSITEVRSSKEVENYRLAQLESSTRSKRPEAAHVETRLFVSHADWSPAKPFVSYAEVYGANVSQSKTSGLVKAMSDIVE